MRNIGCCDENLHNVYFITFFGAFLATALKTIGEVDVINSRGRNHTERSQDEASGSATDYSFYRAQFINLVGFLIVI